MDRIGIEFISVFGLPPVAFVELAARLGVGQCGDDHQLVGVGHDDPLDRVVVVRRAPQHARAGLHLDDPGEASVGAADVADQADEVAGDDALAAQRP